MRLTKGQLAFVEGDPRANLGYGVEAPTVGVGYTQAQALRLIKKAMDEPGRRFEVFDMSAEGALRSARNVADRISTLIHTLRLTDVVKLARYGTKYTISVDPTALTEWLYAHSFVFGFLVKLPEPLAPADTIDDVVPGRAKFAGMIARGLAAREAARPLSALEGKFTEEEFA